MSKYKNDRENRTADMAFSCTHRLAMLLYSQANIIEQMKPAGASLCLTLDIDLIVTRLRQAAVLLHQPLPETTNEQEQEKA